MRVRTHVSTATVCVNRHPTQGQTPDPGTRKMLLTVVCTRPNADAAMCKQARLPTTLTVQLSPIVPTQLQPPSSQVAQQHGRLCPGRVRCAAARAWGRKPDGGPHGGSGRGRSDTEGRSARGRRGG